MLHANFININITNSHVWHQEQPVQKYYEEYLASNLMFSDMMIKSCMGIVLYGSRIYKFNQPNMLDNNATYM